MSDGRQCVRCREAHSVDDEDELCGHCFWVTNAEVASGLKALEEYLTHWAAFAEWEANHID